MNFNLTSQNMQFSRDHYRLGQVPKIIQRRTFGTAGEIYYRPDVLPVTQPTVSKHTGTSLSKIMQEWTKY